MNKSGCVSAWVLGVLLSTGCGSGGSQGGGGGGTGGVPQAAGGYWTGPQAKSQKLDLLLVVDNSLAMADKQKFLMDGVPGLMSRLITPNCVDSNGNPNGGVVDANGNCASGQPEARPIDDIHVGVVSSSLGGRGKTCTPGTTTNPFDDDRGELVGSLRHTGNAADGTDINYSTYANLGFLAWDARGTANNPPGLNDRMALVQTLQKMIVAASEQGCGYESPQEAWYRFLVDPEPPSAVVIDQGQTVAITNPPDEAVLTERAAFLRPDSAVAIVLISDETDCSIIDYGQGWLVADNSQPIPRPTSQCTTNPNDPCCRSCADVSEAYKNCPPASTDANCSVDDGDGNGPGFIGSKYNCACHKCWQTKRRYGVDLLFPIQRYVNALSETVIANRANQPVPNPLFAGGRSPSLVAMVGIVGVPWQDLATADTLDAASPNLTLMTFDQMVAAQPNRWDVVLGDPGASPPIPPSDPFMFESIQARTNLPDTANPITGQLITDPTSQNPHATINGHEFIVNPNTLDDLQHACIFELPAAMTRNCTDPAYNASDPSLRRSCDCKETTTDHVVDRNRALCQPPAGGPAGTQQYFAKAYPGSRHLELLKRMGPRGIVGSVCPKLSSDAAAPSASGYGYNAAMEATVARLHSMIE
jgi:hypothetical protein